MTLLMLHHPGKNANASCRITVKGISFPNVKLSQPRYNKKGICAHCPLRKCQMPWAINVQKYHSLWRPVLWSRIDRAWNSLVNVYKLPTHKRKSPENFLVWIFHFFWNFQHNWFWTFVSIRSGHQGVAGLEPPPDSKPQAKPQEGSKQLCFSTFFQQTHG